MYIDVIKLFAQNGKELGTYPHYLIQAVRLSSDDVGMEWGIEKKCHADNEKRKTANDEKNGTTKSRKIRTLGEKEIYWH